MFPSRYSKNGSSTIGDIENSGQGVKGNGKQETSESITLPIPLSLSFVVARDGIEPPTPAFSGPLTDSPNWLEING